jgi:3-dehydroquinate synthase
MAEVKVALGSRSYKIHIYNGALEQVSSYCSNWPSFIILTDKNVYELYKNLISRYFDGFDYHIYVVEPGETSKNLGIAGNICSFMVEKNMTRKSGLVAFGGGVIGDLGGFCASIFMRGIQYIQIPTTLLATADSSVGGKTGVNLPLSKNSVGAFYQPKAVIIDTSLLESLPKKELLNGFAETIKHGIIKDYSFFKYVKENRQRIFDGDKEVIEYITAKNCAIKAAVVSEDEKEGNIRKILNFGHTYGHAVEAATHYKVFGHGEAVILGILFETRLSFALGLISQDYCNEIIESVEGLVDSSSTSKFCNEDLIDFMLHDKKNSDGKISFILPIDQGLVREHLFTDMEVNKMMIDLVDKRQGGN